MGFGCAIGFGSVIGVLALSTRFRTKYFQVGDRFMNSFIRIGYMRERSLSVLA